MARYPIQGTMQDGNGRRIEGGTVSFFLADTTTPADVYAAKSGGAAVNTVLSDETGGFIAYVDEGDYASSQLFDVTLTKANFTTKYAYDIAPFSFANNIDVGDLADGTDGELITWDSSGEATTVAVGTANQILTSNGIGAEPTFQDIHTEITAWTPQIWDSTSSGSESQAYHATNGGVYFRMGDLVYISGRLNITDLGSLTAGDSTYIGNLPLQPLRNESMCIGFIAGMALPAATGHTIIAHTDKTEKKIILLLTDSTVGSTNLLISEFSDTGDILFTGWYITEDA